MQFTTTLLFTIFFSALALAHPMAGTDTAAISEAPVVQARSAEPDNKNCKRGELDARCFGKFSHVCQGDGRTTILGTLQHANAIPIDCKQITTCDKRGQVVFKGHAGNAVPQAALNACRDICQCHAG